MASVSNNLAVKDKTVEMDVNKPIFGKMKDTQLNSEIKFKTDVEINMINKVNAVVNNFFNNKPENADKLNNNSNFENKNTEVAQVRTITLVGENPVVKIICQPEISDTQSSSSECQKENVTDLLANRIYSIFSSIVACKYNRSYSDVEFDQILVDLQLLTEIDFNEGTSPPPPPQVSFEKTTLPVPPKMSSEETKEPAAPKSLSKENMMVSPPKSASEKNMATSTSKLASEEAKAPPPPKLAYEETRALPPSKLDPEETKTPSPPKLTSEETRPSPPKLASEETRPSPPKLASEETRPSPPKLASEEIRPYLPKLASEETRPYPPKLASEEIRPYPPKLASEEIRPYPPKLASEEIRPYPPKLASEETRPSPPKLASEETRPCPPKLASEETRPSPPKLASEETRPSPPKLVSEETRPSPPKLASEATRASPTPEMTSEATRASPTPKMASEKTKASSPIKLASGEAEAPPPPKLAHEKTKPLPPSNFSSEEASGENQSKRPETVQFEVPPKSSTPFNNTDNKIPTKLSQITNNQDGKTVAISYKTSSMSDKVQNSKNKDVKVRNIRKYSHFNLKRCSVVLHRLTEHEINNFKTKKNIPLNLKANVTNTGKRRLTDSQLEYPKAKIQKISNEHHAKIPANINGKRPIETKRLCPTKMEKIEQDNRTLSTLASLKESQVTSLSSFKIPKIKSSDEKLPKNGQDASVSQTKIDTVDKASQPVPPIKISEASTVENEEKKILIKDKLKEAQEKSLSSVKIPKMKLSTVKLPQSSQDASVSKTKIEAPAKAPQPVPPIKISEGLPPATVQLIPERVAPPQATIKDSSIVSNLVVTISDGEKDSKRVVTATNVDGIACDQSTKNNSSFKSSNEKQWPAPNNGYEFVSVDPAENADNFSRDWEPLRNAENDVERYKLIRKRWMNLSVPDPSRNLTLRHCKPQNSQPKRPQTCLLRKPQRIKSYTAQYEQMIRDAERKAEESLRKLMAKNQHKLSFRLAEHNQLTHLNSNSFYSNSNPFVMNNMVNQRDKDLMTMKQMHNQIESNFVSDMSREIAKYYEYMEEVHSFCSFYQGLDETDSSNKIELTEEQGELMEAYEDMYKRFTQIYKS